jgi:hypothetical protein
MFENFIQGDILGEPVRESKEIENHCIKIQVLILSLSETNCSFQFE